MTPFTTDMAIVYATVPSCLTTSFKPFKMVLSSGPIEIPFSKLTNLNENYMNYKIIVSEIIGI